MRTDDKLIFENYVSHRAVIAENVDVIIKSLRNTKKDSGVGAVTEKLKEIKTNKPELYKKITEAVLEGEGSKDISSPVAQPDTSEVTPKEAEIKAQQGSSEPTNTGSESAEQVVERLRSLKHTKGPEAVKVALEEIKVKNPTLFKQITSLVTNETSTEKV